MLNIHNWEWVRRLKQPKNRAGWIAFTFAFVWWAVGQLSTVEWVVQKLPAEWRVPNPSWAWLPFLFGISWLLVNTVMPDSHAPSLKTFEPIMRSHPLGKEREWQFFVMPIRNQSTSSELKSLSAFLEFRRAWSRKRVQIHDAIWLEEFPSRTDRMIGLSETRHLVLAVVGYNDACPPLAVGYERELRKKRVTLRQAMHMAESEGIDLNVTVEDLPPGKWIVSGRVDGYQYSFAFRTKINVVSNAVIRPL